MKARRGQVAIYLALVLVALALLMVANVNVFLAVRSKNRMMNAVDEAAIAVAKCQGALLNELGRMNVEHLRAAIRGVDREEWRDDPYSPNRMRQMRELAFMRPIEDGVAAANDAAAQWGYADAGAVAGREVFADHRAEILNEYPNLYEQYRDGLWADYAGAFDRAVHGAVLPGYMELLNPWTHAGPLLSQAFYDSIAAKAWCWFSIGGRRQYLEGNVPLPEFPGVATLENCEIHSLHVTFKPWGESEWEDLFDAEWTNFVCKVTGLSREDFSPNAYVTDPNQLWAFYDGNWRPWSQTFNPDNFPVAGTVKPEYDVAGCVASCMMVGGFQQLLKDEDDPVVSRSMLVTAEAKPLGTVRDLDGEARLPVTAYRSFVAARHPDPRIFTEAQLVPMGSVPRSPGVGMAPDWYVHVRHHLPEYFERGSVSAFGCGYCRLLAEWDNGLKAQCAQWLSANEGSCHPRGGDGEEKGGYDYAH